MNEFTVHKLNARGLVKAGEIASVFEQALSCIDAILASGKPQGRERALVVTKLQEACFFAKRAIALLPENQETPSWETP